MNDIFPIEQNQPMTMDSLFPTGQIRLAEISVCNWGSFSQIHTAHIHPGGTLVTGENGAGKSTFIDGLMVLLQPPGRATFNMAAAQDKPDRSLMSYMRGYFGEEEDGPNTKIKSTRNGAVLTGIRALYRGEDGSEITLAGLFWITKSSHALSDVSRHYIVAKGNLTLEALTSRFNDGNAAGLKHWLSENKKIMCSTKSFKDYDPVYKKALYIENSNAANLLGRALGLKKIDDLTKIIRELVLEPSSILEEARAVVSAFDDLVKVRDEVQDARERRDHLKPLVELKESLSQAQKAVDKFTTQYETLPCFLNRQAQGLCEQKWKRIEGYIKTLVGQIEAITQEEGDQQELVNKRYAHYLNAGGNQLEGIKKDLLHANERLNRTSMAAGKYQGKAVKLGLPDALVRSDYDANIEAAESGVEQAEAQKEQSALRFGELASQWSDQQTKIREMEATIEEIEQRPDSNVPLHYQRCCDELVDALGMDPEQCLFIAELLEVKEQEYQWQGAIERALGGQRVTLMVPLHLRSQVAGWMNDRHLGLNLFVQGVGDVPQQKAEFKEDGFLRKLSWRQHSYRDWLKHHLAGSDLHCVENSKALSETPYSMTQQGLINSGRDRFAKKDRFKIDDRQDWSLGFSNKSRLARMQHELGQMLTSVKEAEAAVSSARKVMNDDSANEALWRELKEIHWEDINVPYWQERVQTLSLQREEIESNKDKLADAQAEWESAKIYLGEIRNRKGDLHKRSGELDNALEAAGSQLEALKSEAQGKIDPDVFAQLSELISPMEEADLDKLHSLLTEYLSLVKEKLDFHHNQYEAYDKKARSIMVGFRARDKWKHHASDWDVETHSLKDYIAHYNELVESKLPEQEQRFQGMLNNQTTQSLAKIKTQLESEREDITERIETISDVLEGTEFRRGTVLRLRTEAERFEHVEDFKKRVTVALSMATSNDHEARYKQLSEVMEILAKASDPATCHSLHSQRLLDPRYQMMFIAEEIDRETEEQKDLWKSSMGKSGGEKESFAGAIVAASLAYVLTPDGYNKPIYSTVFLDEAFSNTSESVSRRILNIFKDLKIHVNLITPYKNLNLARESAKTLLMVERDSEVHESRFSEMSWEEIDEKLARNKQKARDAAIDMGIDVEQQD